MKEYKIGDKVQLVADHGYCSMNNIGDIGIIIDKYIIPARTPSLWGCNNKYSYRIQVSGRCFESNWSLGGDIRLWPMLNNNVKIL